MATTEASTQTAIILVTDLVGSTEQRARLGEDAADDLRRAHDGLLADAVSAHGGEVVKGLGDGVLARFTGAADAIGAAVQVQQLCSSHDFDVRVGISAGDITVEGGDVFGTPVIEASRLCAVAGGGQILAADLVQLLARGRGGFAFTPIGDLELKGLSGLVAAVEIGWEQAVTAGDLASVPLQPAMAGDERFAYAGRTREREALTSAWKRAAGGDRRMVLLSGEPGMGKTRLAAELARAVSEDGATVLLGRADEDLTAPYRPLAEALRHLVAHAPAEILETHGREHGDALVRLAPELARRVPSLEPAPVSDDERVALFDASIDLLGRACAQAPVLLVFDDLHWADHSTLLFLRHLVRSAPTMALLVLGTYRDTDLNRDHPLAGVLADLRRESGVERVAIAGLDDAEVVELMTAAAGHELDDDALVLARAVHEETGGNPFFIGEVLWHLAESGLIVERGGRWTTDRSSVISHVPDGVREVIGRRLSALGEDADKAMRTAAVIGNEFDVGTLATVLGDDEDHLIDVLDEPLARRLIIEVAGSIGRFRFAHALVRQALYEELSALRRSRLHARVLEALQAAGHGEPIALAHHACEAAGSAPATVTVELAAQAAAAAAEQLAFEEAVRWYQRALEAEETIEDTDPRRRAALLVALGRSRNALGHANEANRELAEAADLARRSDDLDLLFDAATEYSMGAGAWVDPDDQVGPALLDECLARVPEDDLARRTRLLVARSWWFVLSDPARQVQLTEEAMPLARQLGHTPLLHLALAARANAVMNSPDLSLLSSAVDEMRSLMDERTPVRDRFTIHLNHVNVELRRGDLAAAARATREFAEAATRLRSDMLRFRATSSAGVLDLLAGRIDDARAKCEAAGDVELGEGAGWSTVTSTLALSISRATDLPSEYTHVWQRAVDAAPAFFRVFRAPIAALLDETGASDEDIASLRSWAEHVLPLLPEVFRPAALATMCDHWRGFDPTLAQQLYDQLVPYLDQWLTAYGESAFGSTDWRLGQLARAAGRLDDAATHLDRAIAIHDAVGELAFRPHIACDLAELLLERDGAGDADRARALADEAGRAAAGLGLRWVAQRSAAVIG